MTWPLDLADLLIAEAMLRADLPELVVRRYGCPNCGGEVAMLPSAPLVLVEPPTCVDCWGWEMVELPATPVVKVPARVGAGGALSPAPQRKAGRARRRRPPGLA